MHASLHSLAHRAPGGATRTRVRWQPYNSLPSSVSSRSPYSNTPLSVSPTSTPATSFDSDRLKQYQPPTPSPKDNNSSKHTKYALGLVDQAVKSLCEIWRPQDIPPVFLTTLSSTKNDLVSASHVLVQRNTQLPSPISPSINPSPSSITEQEPNCMFGSRTNLVPIKGFVHEVLRRSRTSGCVLQTALCYLEAIRPKIPELAQQQQSGEAVQSEPELVDRITPATPAEIEQDAELTRLSLNDEAYEETIMATVKVSDLSAPTTSADKKFKTPSEPLAPLAPLPSPLLCPRRAFLAALILASKFTQDKCYSNRAWAKLSGLPPREIGRCERALGEALDWRLWVGKTAAPPSSTAAPSAPPLTSSRSLVRCQSDSNLRTPTKKSAFLVRDESCDSIPTGNGLRRTSTLPANAFSLGDQDVSLSTIPARNHQELFDYPMTVEMPSLSMIPSDNTQCPSDVDASNYPQTELIDPYPVVSFSPCPSLSYSPSSTDSSSSSGDRTIQMSSLDDMPPYNGCTIAPSASESWSWLESSPSGQYPLGKATVQAHGAMNGTQLGKHPPANSKLGPPTVQIAGYGPGQDFHHSSLTGIVSDSWQTEPNSILWSTVS